MSKYAHKGQILPIVNQMIPIDKETTFHASYDYDLNGFNQGELMRPLGQTNAAYFNGVDSFVRVGASPILNSFTEQSIAMWLYVDVTPGQYGMIIGKWDWGSGINQRSYELAISNTNAMRYIISNNGTDAGITTIETSDFPYRQWIHVSATYQSNGTMSLYVDGGLKATGTHTGGLFVTQNPLILGACKEGTFGFWKGKAADIKIWNRALSLDEIKKEAVSNLNESPNLVGYWKLNEKEGSVAFDCSQYHNDGIRYGNLSSTHGPTVATLKKEEGKFRGAVLIEPDTQNIYPGPSTKGAFFTSAYDGDYNFGAITNSQWSIDNSDQPVAGVDVQKISRIESGISQRLYINWDEIMRTSGATFEPGEERTFSFLYYGTYGTRLRPYMSVTGNITLHSDTAITGNGSTSITIGVQPNKWQKIQLRIRNNDATASTFNWGWLVLHSDTEVVALNNTEYWKITGVQVEKRHGATSFIQYGESRPVSRLWYPKELINPSAFTISCWFNIPYMHRTSTNNTGIVGSWYHPIIEIATATSTSQAFGIVAGPEPASWNRRLVLQVPLGITAEFAVQDDTWYHMTTTFDGTIYKVYINGVEQISAAGPAISLVDGQYLMIGGGYQGKPHILIDELRIESRAISPEEVEAWAASGLHYNYLDYSQYVD